MERIALDGSPPEEERTRNERSQIELTRSAVSRVSFKKKSRNKKKQSSSISKAFLNSFASPRTPRTPFINLSVVISKFEASTTSSTIENDYEASDLISNTFGSNFGII